MRDFRTFLTAFLISCSLPLGGCALTDKLLVNRVVVTVSFDECRLDSRWSRPGITTPIDDNDCAVIIEGIKTLIRNSASR